MPQFKLNGGHTLSLVFTDNNNGNMLNIAGDLNLSGSLLVQDGRIPYISGCDQLVLENNTTLNLQNYLSLNRIELNSSKLILTNYHEGSRKPSIELKNNSSLSLTQDSNFNLGIITAEQNSTISFSVEKKTYTIDTFGYSQIVMHDIKIFANIVSFANTFEVEDDVIPMEQYCSFRKYKDCSDNSLLQMVTDENNHFLNLANLDSFVNTHFFEIAGICKNFVGSELSTLPPELIGYIANYLDFGDIVS